MANKHTHIIDTLTGVLDDETTFNVVSQFNTSASYDESKTLIYVNMIADSTEELLLENGATEGKRVAECGIYAEWKSELDASMAEEHGDIMEKIEYRLEGLQTTIRGSGDAGQTTSLYKTIILGVKMRECSGIVDDQGSVGKLLYQVHVIYQQVRQ